MADKAAPAPTQMSQELRMPSAAQCYIIVCVVLFAAWVGFYCFDPFGFDEPGRDTWHHVAVLRELMAAPFNPANPHIPTQEPSRYFTPVTTAAALVGRLLDLSPYALFGYMGAASCIGFVAGCWLFAQRYYRSPWAPLILLLTLLFAWGVQLGNVGFHTYAMLLSSAAYPSTIALVLGLFSWAFVLDALRSERNRVPRLAGLGLLTATILLTHQLSGVMVLTGAGSMILFDARADAKRKAALLTSMATGCLLSLAWPYFNLLDVLSSVSDSRWRSPDEKINRLATVAVLAAPTIAGLFGFRSSSGRLRWELIFPATLFGVAYLGLTLQGSAVAHRFPQAIILFLQLGLVWVIIDYLTKPERAPKAKIILAAAVVLFVINAAVAASVARFKDLNLRASAGSLVATAEAIAAQMPANSISFATEGIVFPLQSTGRRVVSIPRPEPAAASLIERQAATDRFFSGDTNLEERRKLIGRWGVTHIAFTTGELRPEVVRELRLLGQTNAYPRQVEIITIGRATAGNREEHR